MVKWLVVASLVWPVLLASAAVTRGSHAVPAFSAVVYIAASRICHQRPERSFHTAGLQWPVCARCSGLYLAAPIGALAALGALGRRARIRRPHTSPNLVLALAVASVPTAATLLLEWGHLVPISNAVRFLSALPLGAVIAYTVVRMAGGSSGSIEYTGR